MNIEMDLSLPHAAPSLNPRDTEHLAIVDGARTITYAMLHARANQVARMLQQRNLGAESRIGVLMDRSIEFVITVLGIHKAGAAYLPLDLTYPASRLAFILEDVQADLVLHTDTIPSGLEQTDRFLSFSSPSITLQRAEPLEELPPTDDQLAYIIYTSGSTGKPKGVAITHGGLRNLRNWHQERFQNTAEDRTTFLFNIGFDASVWELWPYLDCRATLFLPPAAILRDPDLLCQWIVEQQLTVAFVPTLLAETLIQKSWPSHTTLRYMLTGGDRLRRSPAPGLPFQLINNYGPTECSVTATSGVVDPSPATPGAPSIGRPIGGVKIYILDQNLEEVAPGTPGEICIGGAGVGRGYINRPELTQEKFILWQGSEGPERLYRSGDRGALLDDGSIRFLGRFDDQIQIRGYRVEQGEIESALNRLAEVDTSAVVARGEDAGGLRLVAYVVPAADSVLSREKLRRDLRKTLPEYMVPAEFVRLAELPITDNGKVDRKHLPDPTPDTIITTTDSQATPVELELIAILKALFQLDHIDREDNFFLLGGHSFMAAQIMARVRSRFDIDLNLRTVFDNPTPMALAKQIETGILARL
ncbi:MAG TPA: non-ribosomal peptide synthetase [Granulicella sp.]|nr:non-ribosomal peptide synthetase [Granulicella sp.]